MLPRWVAITASEIWRGQVVGVQFQRAQVACSRLAEAPREISALPRLACAKLNSGMGLEQKIHVVERLGGPVEPLQADGQGIAHADVLRGQRDRTLQELERLLDLALLLKARRGHVKQQGVFEA